MPGSTNRDLDLNGLRWDLTSGFVLKQPAAVSVRTTVLNSDSCELLNGSDCGFICILI